MPMNVEPQYNGESIWGFKVGIFKNGVKLTDIGVGVSGQGIQASAPVEWTRETDP